jgi:hypothetical protein
MPGKTLAVILALLLIPGAGQAKDSITVSGGLTDVYAWYGTVEVSAYYPGEDGENLNHSGAALSGLVDEIVATQTRGGHSELLGKTVMLVTPDGERLIRRVDDRGCYKGRLDLLVADAEAMNEWGLAECGVWVLEEAG